MIYNWLVMFLLNSKFYMFSTHSTDLAIEGEKTTFVIWLLISRVDQRLENVADIAVSVLLTVSLSIDFDCDCDCDCNSNCCFNWIAAIEWMKLLIKQLSILSSVNCWYWFYISINERDSLSDWRNCCCCCEVKRVIQKQKSIDYEITINFTLFQVSEISEVLKLI